MPKVESNIIPWERGRLVRRAPSGRRALRCEVRSKRRRIRFALACAREIRKERTGRPRSQQGLMTDEAEQARQESSKHKEWYSRGYVPHFDHAGLIQMITFRLADALPSHLLDQWEMTLGREND